MAADFEFDELLRDVGETPVDFDEVLRDLALNDPTYRNLILSLVDFNEDQLVQILATAQQSTSITSVAVHGGRNRKGKVYTELSAQTARALGEALLALPVTKLSFETLKFEDFGPVAQVIRRLKYRKIGLEFDHIDYLSGGLKEGLLSLLQSNAVESLTFGPGTRDGPGELHWVADALHSNRSVKRLGYTDSISSTEIRALSGVLRENTVIEELDLRCAYLRPTMFLDICHALVEGRFALTKLTLPGAGYTYATEDVAEADALANTEAAVVPVLSFQRLCELCELANTELAVSVLAKHTPSLQHLCLVHGRWNIVGLCDALITCKLESLHLVRCCIGDAECQALADVLVTHETLKQVDFSGNRIGNEGASALGRALVQNATIEDINVANNSIGPEGASAITGALLSNGSVKKIDISINPIGDDGATSVFEMLTRHDAIEFVGLDLVSVWRFGPRVGGQAFNALIAFLPRMTTVKKLRVLGLEDWIAETIFDVPVEIVRDQQRIFVQALEQNTALVDLDMRQQPLPQPVEDILTRNRITLPLRRRDRADTVLERWGRDANSLLHILGESPQDVDVLYFALHELLDKVFPRIGERDVASPSSESSWDVVIPEIDESRDLLNNSTTRAPEDVAILSSESRDVVIADTDESRDLLIPSTNCCPGVQCIIL